MRQMTPSRDVGLLRGLLHERVTEHRWATDSRGVDVAREELTNAMNDLVDHDPEHAKRLLVAAVDLLAELQ